MLARVEACGRRALSQMLAARSPALGRLRAWPAGLRLRLRTVLAGLQIYSRRGRGCRCGFTDGLDRERVGQPPEGPRPDAYEAHVIPTADRRCGHCQLSRPWYARCVGGAAAWVGRSFARLLCCPL